MSLRIQLKYGRNFILQYEDDQNDKITIDSQDILNRAMLRADVQGFIRIHLLPATGLSASLVAAPTSSWITPSISSSSSGLSSLSSLDSTLFSSFQDQKRAVINELSYESKLSKSDLERLYQEFQNKSTNGQGHKTTALPSIVMIALPIDNELNRLLKQESICCRVQSHHWFS